MFHLKDTQLPLALSFKRQLPSEVVIAALMDAEAVLLYISFIRFQPLL